MVRLGMGTGSVPTALDLEEGLEFLGTHVAHPQTVPARGSGGSPGSP
jgi:hypothetical protein